ncbi:hypothetical protein TrCOL_g8936 [Triparma columacea]|uniref:VTT domain-containing protein n=1 Tax=Triparma columacea TaxID=722753 RepID=A0A9W7LCG9_9STRA|nr:hypothetical protein TrCOL_g8936 [Triparma columacea]
MSLRISPLDNNNSNNPKESIPSSQLVQKGLLLPLLLLPLLYYLTLHPPLNLHLPLNLPQISPVDFLQSSVSKIQSAGPLAFLYFSLLYILAEVLAIPAIPLTASAGYLFGTFPGTLVVLLSASVAASISFYLGRTYLRTYVTDLTSKSNRLLAIDRAVAQDGFKVILLLRLSPIFPFALSNYVYGASSVKFKDYILATVLGFAPGTLGYVYTGTVGKVLVESEGGIGGTGGIMGGGSVAMLAGFGGVLAFAKIVGDIATKVVGEIEGMEEIEREEGQDQ